MRHAGIRSEVWPITSAADLRSRLAKFASEQVIVSAPWIPSLELQALANDFPETHFTVNCHSNVGFLQADRNGVKLIREVVEMEAGTHNIHLAGNCRRFCDWVNAAFAVPCAYLPNLYYLDEHAHSHPPANYSGGPLGIGAFGATRPLKNLMSAAGAALEIARSLRAPLNSGSRPGARKAVVKRFWPR